MSTKESRVIWARRIKGFWTEFSHNRVGLFGVALVLLYGFVAVFAYWIIPYDPTRDRFIANEFSEPEWITIFPGNKYLPRTVETPLSWTVQEASPSIEIMESGDKIAVSYDGDQTATIHSVNFTTSFLYPYTTPDKFSYMFTWNTENVTNVQYYLELYMTNYAGTEFMIWTSYVFPQMKFLTMVKNLTYVNVVSDFLTGIPHLQEALGISMLGNVAHLIFTEPGEYGLRLQMVFQSTKENATTKVNVRDARFKIYGMVHGLLGTDHMGRDVYSQLIAGTQISLAVGLLAAVLSTSIGITVGITAGYSEGFVDEFLMRIVDMLLCLPVLPLLLAFMLMFGSSVWNLVILIAVFGWLGMSRIIRSQVLSLKEMPFVECARAAGASDTYIMIKHMVPNVLPIALTALVLSVPVAILTEAAISFIGLGDPTSPTWGRMLQRAFNAGGFRHMAWWWIIPPGMAITILTLSFVAIGHAVDEVVNPKLRRRR